MAGMKGGAELETLFAGLSAEAPEVGAGRRRVYDAVMACYAHAIVGLTILVLITGLTVAGADRGETLSLHMKEAVLLALERNLDLTIERIEPLLAHEQIRQAAGEFDPLLKLSAIGKKQELPVTSALELGNESGVIVEESFSPETGLAGKFTTGTQYSVALVAPVIKTDHPNRLFSEYYRPVLNFGVTQPLLRDIGTEVNLVRFRQAEKAERIATLGVEAKMLSVIRDVETNYWALFFAQQHVEVAQGSLQLAEDLVQRVRRLRGAGLATALDLRTAETGVEARRGDLQRAEADLRNVQAQLRVLINPDLDLRTRIRAVEEPADEGVPVDLEEKLAQALARRPEPQRQKLVIENLQLEELLAKNNTRVRLDLIGNLGYTGLAGSGNGPRVVAVPARLQGRSSYTEAFSDFLTPDGNITWSTGLQLQVPLGNREALGRLEQTRLRQQQERLRLLLLTNQISVEVQTAFQDMTAEWARFTALREEVKLSREQLAAQERQFGAGLSTVRQLLEAQDAVAKAEDKRIQALMHYSTARSRLAAAVVASFDTYRLVIQP